MLMPNSIKPLATVILAFYNKIDYLKLVLTGFEIQTEKNFEIIISDDGSRKEIVEELEKLIEESDLKIKHLWQEDKGFRKNRLLNKSITEAQSDYIIFVDADCIPHRRFIEEHLKNAQKNCCLTGRRVNLSKKITEKVTKENIKKGFLEKNHVMLFFDQLLGDSRHIERGFYFKMEFMRNWLNRAEDKGVLGCNFSAYKSDLLKVNGFDERYEAPAIGEDTDIQFRLELIGVKVKTLISMANQYHLYHKLLPRIIENEELFKKVQEQKIAFTPYGIKKLNSVEQ